MDIKINGESLIEIREKLCNDNLISTEVSQKMCDIVDVQIDMTIQSFELMKDYISTILGMF